MLTTRSTRLSSHYINVLNYTQDELTFTVTGEHASNTHISSVRNSMLATKINYRGFFFQLVSKDEAAAIIRSDAERERENEMSF